MTPVRSRMPIPGSRFVLSVSGLMTSTRTSSTRVVSMRDFSDSLWRRTGLPRPRRDLRVALLAEIHDLGLVLGEVRENFGDEVVRRRDAAGERIVRERFAQNRDAIAQRVVVRSVARERLVGRERPAARESSRRSSARAKGRRRRRRRHRHAPRPAPPSGGISAATGSAAGAAPGAPRAAPRPPPRGAPGRLKSP